MSVLYPIIAVTGSSGAGTTSAEPAFKQIFQRQRLTPAFVGGDSYHRYDRAQMLREVEKAAVHGWTLTHFGPEGNLFAELEALFKSYATGGAGNFRHYVHTEYEAKLYGSPAGKFTAWQPIPPNTDLLFYEGLHGGLATDTTNIARYVDLLIGVVPIINLEWIQKIHRDKAVRGYTTETATRMILRRMSDYVHYICPQFSRTDINFQRIPTIDTSNPFTAASIPTNAQSLVVIHIANRDKIQPDLAALARTLPDAFMSAEDTIVLPAAKTDAAIDFLLAPVVARLIKNRDHARASAAA